MARSRTALALAATAALALPAAALAKPHHEHVAKTHHHVAKTHDKGAGHDVQYVFRGTWSGGSLQVTGGNAHVRHAGLVGQTVAFDLTAARFVVTDANGDGTRDASDVQDGDRVLVQARLPRRDLGSAPFAARKLVDQTERRAQQDGSGDDAPTASPTPPAAG